ncbi:MAG: toprim domain-containing protein, partial [Immundisolibacteraceae bacterium]|nr:toprim domain-containing protein [Immundisolibacteraceae bacterium]
PIFHKGAELYGLYQLQQVQRQPPQIVVVEGYLDVIALAQFGATYAVAALGTALTADHIRKLYRVTPKLVLCFDGDKAGRRAAERSLENLAPQMQEGRQADFLFLPDGDDPDTFIRREGLDGFESAVKSSEPLSKFLFEHLESDCDMTTLDGKARLAELAKPWIGKLPEGFFKQLMRQELNQRTGIELPEERTAPPNPSSSRQPFSDSVSNSSRSRTSTTEETAQQSATKPVSSRLLRKAFVLLLNQPELAQQISLEELTRLAGHDAPGISLLCMLIDHFNCSPNASIGLFLDQLDVAEEAATIARLIRQPVPPGDSDSWTEEFQTLLADITGVIHHQRGRLGDHNRRRLNELYGKFSASGLSDEEKIEMRQLQQQYQGQSRREP